MAKIKLVVIGAAGRDFHNFNALYRDNPDFKVVAFTAAQIPDIAGRKYPASLAGSLYPDGISIEDEKDLEKIIKDNNVNECLLSYSDLSYNSVMRLASRVITAGAKFSMMGAEQTMLKSSKPVINVVAVRTGCGKSQTTRAVVEILKEAEGRVVSIRHPMPYGDLEKQKVQRFGVLEDLKKHQCTIEEMEEYEPHIIMGSVIYAGIDYQAILSEAEKEADIIVWDGGNNDTSFYHSDLTITVADPLRPGHEIGYYPGEVNFRLADVIIIGKINSARPEDVDMVIKNAQRVNPQARIIKAESVISIDHPEYITGKRVLVVEDGPTVTHGEMTNGAGTVAAERNNAKEIIDPRPFITGKIKETFNHYPNIGKLLPAMGYGEKQMADLEKTINAVDCDSVVIGTPIDLGRFLKINKPTARVRYGASDETKTVLREIIKNKKLI